MQCLCSDCFNGVLNQTWPNHISKFGHTHPKVYGCFTRWWVSDSKQMLCGWFCMGASTSKQFQHIFVFLGLVFIPPDICFSETFLCFFIKNMAPCDFFGKSKPQPVENPWKWRGNPWNLVKTSCFEKTSCFANPWRTRRIPVATRREPVEFYGFFTPETWMVMKGFLTFFSRFLMFVGERPILSVCQILATIQELWLRGSRKPWFIVFCLSLTWLVKVQRSCTWLNWETYTPVTAQIRII